MVAKNLKVSAPIIAVKLIGPQRLAILIDMQTFCLVRLIDSVSQKPLMSCKIEFSTKNALYYCVDDFTAGYDAKKRAVQIIRLESGVIEYNNSVVPYHTDLSTLALTKNGYFYATGDRVGNVNVWSSKIKEPRFRFQKHTSEVTALCFSADNNELLSGSADGSVVHYELDCDTTTLLLTHSTSVTKVLFLEQKVLSADRNGTVAIFDLQRKEIIHEVYFESGIKEINLAYGRSCIIVLTNDGGLFLVNLEAMDIAPLKIDSDLEGANSLTFDDLNRKLIVSTQLGHLLFYDLDQDHKVIAYAQVQHDDAHVVDDVFVFMTVDDSKMVRNIVKKSLHKGFENVEVLEAGDGAEALNMVHEHKIDCILLDWNMPQFTGIEVLRYIRAFRKFDDIKVIMATTEGERSKIVSTIKLGADGYIVKPFNTESLLDNVSKYISVDDVEKE